MIIRAKDLEISPLPGDATAGSVSRDTAVDYATVSQAISLKRIADSLDLICGKSPDRMGLVDGVMHAIEAGIRASR